MIEKLLAAPRKNNAVVVFEIGVFLVVDHVIASPALYNM